MKKIVVTTPSAWLILSILAACGSESPSPPPAGAGGRGDGIRASAGCGTPAPVTPGDTAAFALRSGDLDREYLLHLPPDYDPVRPAALVLDFHGYTGTAEGEEPYTGLSRHADARSFAVVYPQSTAFVAGGGKRITSWNDLAGSGSPGPEGPICTETARKYPNPPECGEPTPCNWATCHDDLGFVELLLDRLESDLCLDLDRVYATGLSNGGMFVHRLGCDLPRRFAAVAPVGGTLARGFNCAPGVPLAMMNVYGSEDVYVSQRGGVSSDGYYYTSAEAMLRQWAEAQGCDPATSAYPTSRDGTFGLSCIQHDGCATGAEVVHCVWDGAHDWPRAEGDDFGNQVIWEFFSRHSRARYP